jgi:ribokinase
MDIRIEVDHLPRVGETVVTQNTHVNPGGKGANQAYAAGKLGACVSMLGAVGDDEYGKALVDNLNSVGVDTNNIIVKKNEQSGMAIIMVDNDGDNRIIVVSGANKDLSIDDIKTHIDCIKQADIIIMQMEIDTKVVMFAARVVKEYNKIVILDPAPVKKDIPKELFKYVDILKPNETELSMLTETENVLEHLDEATEKMLNLGVRNVLVSLGGKGVYVSLNTNERFMIKGYKVKVIDTTAAGDAFTAAIATQLALGKGIIEAVKYGNMVAALVVTKQGSQQSIPSIQEIREMKT